MIVSRMVALGSSFAAGPGIEPVVDRGAGRSARNYPHLVAAQLGVELVDATVSGATTSTILDVSQRIGLRRYPPQIDAVSADTDLVTVTAGGNDLGYLGSVLSTALLQGLWRRRLTRPIARRIRAGRPLTAITPAQADAARDGLVRIVEAARARAPHAVVMLVDYLPIFTEQSIPGPEVPFRESELDHFRGIAVTLSAIFADAAARADAELVPASDYPSGHGVGSAEPWINPLLPGLRLGGSFHPNASGMAAVARQITGRIRSL